jgi:predicted MFS family arabinose efflux permease
VTSPLKSPQQRRIIAAYTINRLGTWIGTIALSVAVFDHTRSALAVAATLLAAQVVPAFAVPALVAQVEASTRRRDFSGLYFFEAVVTATIGVLLWHFWLPGVLFLVALDGTAALAASALLRTQAAGAAAAELTALAAPGTTVHEDDVHAAQQEANAALNIAFSLTFVMGPAIGGALAAGVGAPSALFLDAASFLICGGLLIDMHSHVEETASDSVRARLRSAWSHIKGAPVLRSLLLTQAVALVFFAAAPPIEVAYAKVTLGAGDRGFGLLVAVWGLGVMVGSIVFARSSRRPLGAMLSAGTLAVGLAYLGFAAAPSLALACVAALLGGIGNGVQWAPLISAVQRLTPQPLQGRVMGAVESMGAVSPAVGLSLGGVLVALSSPRTAFLVVGGGAALMTIAFARIRLPAPPKLRYASDEVDHVQLVSEPAIGPHTPVQEPSAR